MTRVDIAILCARIAAATVFIAHGSQKMFGAFGGPGLAGTVQFLGLIGYLVAVGEFFGGIGVLLGVMSRFSAAAQIVIMIGAVTVTLMTQPVALAILPFVAGLLLCVVAYGRLQTYAPPRHT